MVTGVRDTYYQLLREFSDALLSCAVNDPEHPSLDGAILCPACGRIHGRCHEAVYPLLAMADLSGETKYLTAARRLFTWSGTMVCDDGSLYNDAQSDWNGTTVFAALSLEKALRFHGHLLTGPERSAWEDRLLGMGLWLLDGISPEKKHHINYIAAGAAALKRLGLAFSRDDMLRRARYLAESALSRVTEEGLIFGEGSLARRASPRGGCAVDIGYNVEVTLPALYEYAAAVGDEAALKTVRKAAEAHLELMLPDGAWDNSFGTRNFKWTWWGGRTSDGCQALFNALGKSDPKFAEAALRNLELLRRCTHGLLYGGPHYRRHGEEACAHHAFCRMKVLAQALDEGVTEFERTALPSDDPERVKVYPGIGTVRLARGGWRMTVCAGDFPCMKGGHASGGAVTLLWHRSYGPVFAAANTDFSLREPMNQQLTRRKKLQGCVCPRLEREADGARYSQIYDLTATVTARDLPDRAEVRAEGRLCDISHQPAEEGNYTLTYRLSDEGLYVCGRVTGGDKAVFRLPVICPADDPPNVSGREALIGGRIRVTASGPIACQGTVFSLAPGFEAADLRVSPGEDGALSFSVTFGGPDPNGKEARI